MAVVQSAPPVAERSGALLAERERRSLQSTALLRLSFLALCMAIALPASGRPSERLAILGVGLVGLAVGFVALSSLRKRPAPLRLVGWLHAGTDLFVIAGLPIIWHVIYTTPNEPLLHLTRHNYTAVCLFLLALNAFSVRAIYPAVVGAAVVAAHVTLAALSLLDPRVAREGAWNAAAGVGTGEFDVLVVTPVFIAFGAVVLALSVRTSRATVVEAVAREQREHEQRERQLEAVLEAKLSALGELVAGVEHEINSPLGTLRSATDTAERSLARLRDASEGLPPTGPRARALAALEQSLSLNRQASQRMTEVMGNVKGFVKLDGADLGEVDLAALLRNVMRVHGAVLRQDTELVSDLEEGITARVDARRVAQALRTVLLNAAESFEGPGTLEVSLRREGDRAEITVRDEGRGMSEAQLAALFDMDFTANSRVRARFGLALCRSILHRHGGGIEIDSEVGRGTTVRLSLPLDRGAVG